MIRPHTCGLHQRGWNYSRVVTRLVHFVQSTTHPPSRIFFGSLTGAAERASNASCVGTPLCDSLSGHGTASYCKSQHDVSGFHEAMGDSSARHLISDALLPRRCGTSSPFLQLSPAGSWLDELLWPLHEPDKLFEESTVNLQFRTSLPQRSQSFFFCHTRSSFLFILLPLRSLSTVTPLILPSDNRASSN